MPTSRRLLVPRAGGRRVEDFAMRRGLIAAQRHAARRHRRARRALRASGHALRILLAAAVLLVVGRVGLHWLRTTPFLAIGPVEVVGARTLSEAEVLEAAAIETGTSILGLDPAAVERRVAGLPAVRRVRVVRHLPRRVTVMLEEREPYALVNSTGPGAADRLVWVDGAGRLIGPDRHPPPSSLPILSGVAAGGDHPPSDGLRAGMAILRAVQRSGGRVAPRISEIDVAATDGPALYLVDGTEVQLGAEAWDERLARLDGVLGDLETRGERVSYVDLRFRDLVVLRPRPAPGAAADPRAGAPGARRGPTPSPPAPERR